MKEFRTYRPLLSAIKKEYEDTITLQQEELQRLHQLTLRLQHETENHEQQVEARCADKETQIQGLRTERQQLRVQLTSMREREESLQAVVERLQSDLSSQYLKYREERDARQMLIRQLKHLTAPPVRVEPPADDSSEEPGDPAVLQLALRVCRNDLCEAQKELKRIKAERRSSDSVQQ
ncbi:translin-associated factor X-interacting protein 1 isoform 1-T3 [Synchiropus picturatus]